jgi:septal ring factor EnvC (AmiA/AmiB activator)
MWENFHKISLSLLVIFISLSFFIWPNKWKDIFGGSHSNLEIQNLQIENAKLIERNKQIDEAMEAYRLRIVQDSLRLDSLKQGIIFIDKDISKLDNTIIITKKQLETIRKEREEIKKTIEKIKTTPNEDKRGDELIFSIKKRLK